MNFSSIKCSRFRNNNDIKVKSKIDENNVHNVRSLSRYEQVCLLRLRFKR